MSATKNRHAEDDRDMPLENAESLLRELASLSSPIGGFAKRIKRPDVEARYQTLVEQMPAVIFMAFLGDSACEAYVSPQIETALGFTQEEWLNDPVRWYRQIHPADRERWSVEAAQLVSSGQPVRSVYRVIARDGRVVWFHCEVKMVFADDGRPWFLHGTAFDITDLKETEEALKEAQRELETRVQQRTAELARKAAELARLNADLEQFAYSASHDLQQPLRNLAIYSQLLQRRYGRKLDPEANEFLDILSESARHMSTMLEDLRTYSQTFSDDRTAFEPVDANDVFAKSVDDLHVAIDDAQAIITSDRLPQVPVREIHLHQIFQNLLSNALKYRSEEPPRIHVSAAESGCDWLFSIRDNGIGIEPDYQNRIFELFRRLHTQQAYPGTGMGLAICKSIVERYGGRIWVESEAHRGATFFFTFPRMPEYDCADGNRYND